MTILRSNQEFKSKRTLLFRNFFEIDKEVKEVDRVIRYYDTFFNKISEKTGNHIERIEAFYIILDVLQVNIEAYPMTAMQQFFEEADALFLEYPPHIIWHDVDKVLNEIVNRGKTASILSNTAFIYGDSLRKALKELNLEDYFSFFIFSDEVGISKPNIRIFEYLYKKTQEMKVVDKSKIVHIGDSISADYNGAIAFGINADLVNFF